MIVNRDSKYVENTRRARNVERKLRYDIVQERRRKVKIKFVKNYLARGFRCLGWWTWKGERDSAKQSDEARTD